MSASITALPVWKKNSSPAEWLQELATLALENPDRWARIVVVVQRIDDEGLTKNTRSYSHDMRTESEIIAALEIAKLLAYDELMGR